MRYSVFVLACVIVGAAECEYPEIGVLSAADVLYRQLQDDIQRYHQRGAAREEGSPQLLIYRYRKRHGDTIGIIASQTNLTVCTIATINRLGTFEDFNDLSYVLLPNQPGAYIPVDRKSILEEMMYSRRTAATVPGRQIVIQDRPKPSSFLFFPGENFNAVENAYFLKTLFRYPLARVEITSWFGERSNPLTGSREWHKGIDLRAREGTEVRAAAAGIVEEIGSDTVYGFYVVIAHPGEFETVYAHLKTIEVRPDEEVRIGSVIGRTGSTGMATGPHLHFEIRQGSVPRDPLSALRNR